MRQGLFLACDIYSGGILKGGLNRGACSSSVLAWAELHCFGLVRPNLAPKVLGF